MGPLNLPFLHKCSHHSLMHLLHLAHMPTVCNTHATPLPRTTHRRRRRRSLLLGGAAAFALAWSPSRVGVSHSVEQAGAASSKQAPPSFPPGHTTRTRTRTSASPWHAPPGPPPPPPPRPLPPPPSPSSCSSCSWALAPRSNSPLRPLTRRPPRPQATDGSRFTTASVRIRVGPPPLSCWTFFLFLTRLHPIRHTHAHCSAPPLHSFLFTYTHHIRQRRVLLANLGRAPVQEQDAGAAGTSLVSRVLPGWGGWVGG